MVHVTGPFQSASAVPLSQASVCSCGDPPPGGGRPVWALEAHEQGADVQTPPSRASPVAGAASSARTLGRAGSARQLECWA